MSNQVKTPSKGTSRRKRVLLALGYYDQQLHRGIARYARQAEWILNTSMAHYGVLPEYWKGDGIITLMFESRKDIVDYVRSTSASVIDLTCNVDVDVPRVLLDNRRIGRLAAEHLIKRGFTNLAYFRFTRAFDIDGRYEGFVEYVKEQGLSFHVLDWQSESTHYGPGADNWIAWLTEKLANIPRPLGIMAQSDNRAIGVLNLCESLGLGVPEEIAVVGVDNDELVCEFAPVPLSSVDSNRELFAYQAAVLLDRIMHGESPPNEPLVIQPKGVVVRKSSDILAVDHVEVASALGYIWEHFREPIGVDQVLEATSMSRCGLYRAFNKHIGRSIADEITRKRIEYAQELLVNTDEKIHQIARLSGFSGGEHLSRSFTKAVGINPSVYRKKNRAHAVESTS